MLDALREKLNYDVGVRLIQICYFRTSPEARQEFPNPLMKRESKLNAVREKLNYDVGVRLI